MTRARTLASTGLLLLASIAAAQETALVTAAEWRESCTPYLATLRGETVDDDLKITYCVGQTKGIVEAMDTTSRIGAVSFASTLTVAFGLDQGQVFALFEKMQERGFLGLCRPDDIRTANYVETVDRYVAANPAKANLSVAVVFFEALQEAYPCEESSGGG